MIEVQGLCKRYGDFEALKGVDLHVRTGSIYGLIGVNGSGKTTLIRHLTGVLKADSGEIEYDGKTLYENAELKDSLGYIPDELYFFSSYSIKNMAEYYSKIYSGWDQKLFESIVADLNLPMNGRLAKFSKGMEKQAALALTLATKPKYLILDEPLDGLDPLVRKKVLSYIMDGVAERQMSVLVSSHNLRELEGFCDYVGILSEGRMRIERDLEDLKADTHKIQIAFPEEVIREEVYRDLNILKKDSRGVIDLLIIRDKEDKIREQLESFNPIVFDMLPLTLEEIFIYEMGGEHSDIKEILL